MYNQALRLDRLLTLLKAKIQPANSKCPTLPVLMYHSISNFAEPHRSPYYKLNTSPRVFRDQLSTLKKLGYVGLNAEIALERFRKNPNERIVAITFDDGFRDFYTDAYPILQESGFSASVYLPTAYISNSRKQFKGQDCLTWLEVKELRCAGMSFGSHTVSHQQLHKLQWPQVEVEIRESKKVIEHELGEKVVTFSYPYAFPETDKFFTARLSELLRETGFSRCLTTIIGRVNAFTSEYLIPRLPVNECDDSEFLRAKVLGNYDWLALPQRIIKTFKAQRSSLSVN